MAVILFSFLLSSCATVVLPQAIEDSDDGLVLVVTAAKLQEVVENWGYNNGFQYVAYRRLAARTAFGGGGGQTYYWVSVKGINDPKDAPENYNVFTVPSTLHKEFTEGSKIAVATIGILLLAIILPIVFIL